MDEDRPTLSYRTPAAAAPDPGATPRETLAELTAPMLGKLRVELGLGAPIRLSLDREELRLTPGSGLRVQAAALPTLQLRHLRIDLARAELEHDATGLGAFETRAVSVGLATAFTHVADWQPGRSIVDLLLQNLPQRADGRRRVFAKGPASVWLDPETRIDLAVTPENLELSFSHAVYLRVIGLGIGLLAVRYLFGRQKLEIQGPSGQPLRNALLRFVAWVATRFLRKRLPPALATPGYDPFADPQRRAHFEQLIARFSKPAPARADSEPAPSDSPGASAPSDSSHAATTADTATQTKDDTHESAKRDDLVARLASLKDLHLSPGPIPPTSRLLAVVPLGAHGSLALCTDRGQNVELRRRGPRIALDAPAGLYLHAENAPGLDDLRIKHVAVAFGPVLVEVGTEPALGSFTQAAIQQVARVALTSKLPPAVLARIEGLGTSDELLRQPLGDKATLTITTPRNDEILLRHGPDALELIIAAGLELRFDGLDFLPDATIKGLRYAWSTGELKLDATPDLGDLGNNLVSQLFRARAAAHLPPMLGARGPDGQTPVDPDLAAARPAVAFAKTVPALGPIEVRLDPSDRIGVGLSSGAIELTSGTGVALLAPEIEFALVLKQFRFDLGPRGLSADQQLGAYITTILTGLLEKSALPPLQQRLPSWKRGADITLPWQIVRINAGPLGPIDVDLAAGGALVVERNAEAIELRVDPSLMIRAERQNFVPVLAFRRLRWEPATDAWIVELDPPLGPLVPRLLRRVVHKLVPFAQLEQVAQILALPALADPRVPVAAAPDPSTVMHELVVPQLGAVQIAADPEHLVDVELTRRAAVVSFGAGVTAYLPGLAHAVQLRSLEVVLRPLGAHLTTEPDAGPLFDHVISTALRGLLKDYADQFWPGDQAPRIGQDTLLVLGRGQPWGPLRVAVPTDGAIAVHLDRHGFALRSQAGIFISGPAIDWLPEFYLHTVGYAFDTGAVTLEISGIEETYYHEKHPVSPVTQALLAHLVKVLALPKLPAWTERFGLHAFPLPPVPTGDPGRISMYRVKLPGEFGEVQVSMPPDDTVTVRVDDVEASVVSERGLFATLPGLRFELQLRGVRYHMQSGEIQVGGLGQLENALLEAVVARQLNQNVKQIATETPGDVRASLSTMLEQLPVDDEGRRVLFGNTFVSVLLPADPTLIIRFTADGLAFTSDPPLTIDGPARLNFAFNGIRYSFAEATFRLDLDNAGAAVAGLMTPVIINQVEKRLTAIFKPLLPPPMREPGYSLATDPHSEQHIQEIIQNFTLLGERNKQKKAAKAAT